MKQFTRIEPTTVQQVGDKFKRQVVIKHFRTDDGLEHEFTTFNKEHAQAAAVLALTPDNLVIVARQFRPSRERYVEDIPGGAVEAGEDFEYAARRELLEESGYQVGKIRYLGKYSWNANTNLTSHYFLATDCVKADDRVTEQIELDQGLETHLISIERLIQNACSDNMTDAPIVLMAYDALMQFSVSKHNIKKD